MPSTMLNKNEFTLTLSPPSWSRSFFSSSTATGAMGGACTEQDRPGCQSVTKIPTWGWKKPRYLCITEKEQDNCSNTKLRGNMKLTKSLLLISSGTTVTAQDCNLADDNRNYDLYGCVVKRKEFIFTCVLVRPNQQLGASKVVLFLVVGSNTQT